MFRTLLKFIVVTACVAGFSGGVLATTLSTLSVVDSLCGSLPQVNLSSANDVSTFYDSSVGQCEFGGEARSGNGAVGISLALITAAGLGGQAIGSVEVKAETLIEIAISTPKDYAGGEIAVSLSPHLSGSTSATIVSGVPFARAGRARLEAFASISGASLDAATLSSTSASALALAQAVTFSVGVPEIDGELLPGTLALSTIFIDPTQVVQVLFRLTAGVGHSAFNSANVTANVLSLNSLSFSLLGPALILPEGFSANSELGLIVDNVFVGGADVSAVPVPAALPLFGTGLAVMGFIGWRRKRKLVAAA